MVVVATLQQRRRRRGRRELLLVPLQVMRQPGATMWRQELPGRHHPSLQLLQVKKRPMTITAVVTVTTSESVLCHTRMCNSCVKGSKC